MNNTKKVSNKRKSGISNDYVVFLEESRIDLGIDNDPFSFFTTMGCDDFTKWIMQ